MVVVLKVSSSWDSTPLNFIQLSNRHLGIRLYYGWTVHAEAAVPRHFRTWPTIQNHHHIRVSNKGMKIWIDLAKERKFRTLGNL